MALTKEDIKQRLGLKFESPEKLKITPEDPTVKVFFDRIRANPLPASVDLRPNCSPIKNQGQLGSCTANSHASVIEFLELKQAGKYTAPSRLFIYYNTRHLIEGTSGDVGATISDTMESTVKFGAVPETELPYDITKFDNKPSSTCYTDAMNYQTLTQVTVSTIDDIQHILAEGLPVEIGILVFESFEQVGSDGIVPMPKSSEELLGGHALNINGYITINGVQYFIIKNSWGTEEGDNGWYYLPFSYFTKTYEGDQPYASDFKVILTEEYINEQPQPIPPIGDCPTTLSNAKTIIYNTLSASKKITALKKLIPK